MLTSKVTNKEHRMGDLAKRRVPRTPEWIVFLGGINLILIQWILVRELTMLLLGTELVVLLVSVSYFSGLSLGYYVSSYIKRAWYIPIGILTLILHLTLPIWFRLLVVALDQSSVYWLAFIVLPILTPFAVSTFYSILLPALADQKDADVPTLYLFELFGSIVGVLALVVLGGMGLPTVLLVYTLILLLLLMLLRINVMFITVIMMISILWVSFFPTFNNWSNALWYQQLRHLPENTTTLFSSYSPYQKVDVMQDPNGDRYLYLDGLLHFGTNRWSRLNVMMGSVPAELLHPQNTLVVGAGSMQLERLIAEHDGQVTTVELDSVVVQASTTYFADYNLMDILTKTYLLITLCWLVGSAIGVRYVAQSSVSQRVMLGLMIVSFFLIGIMVNTQPFNTQFVPLYGGLIILAGLYPGIFFARLSETYTARLLFFWENNGFILGMVSTTLLFMIVGQLSFVLLPLCLAGIVWWFCENLEHSSDLG